MHRALADIPRGKEVLAVMVLAAEYPWEKVERMLLTAVPCTVIIFTISVIEVLNARSLLFLQLPFSPPALVDVPLALPRVSSPVPGLQQYCE